MFQELPSAPPGAGPTLSFVWYFICLVLLVVGGLIVILYKRRERIEDISGKRANELEGLVKIRDGEMARATQERVKLEEELRDVESELNVATGVKMQELFQFWAEKERIEGRVVALESENRALRRALNKWERGEVGGGIHTTEPPTGRP